MTAEERTLSAVTRENTGTGSARAHRRRDFVPAVLYGGDKEAVAIAIPKKELMFEVDSEDFLTRIYEITVGDEKVRALPRAVQNHPVNGRAQHIDFQRVDERTRLRVQVPVRFLNEENCQGLREGGVLNIVRHRIEIHCRAAAIPSEIVVDLEGFMLGESIHADKAQWPAGVRPVLERNFTIATVAAPSALRAEALEAAEAEEAEAAAEAEGEGETPETPQEGDAAPAE
ncbi:MAG: 50S ribosomal protein L25/general stress protein Ctc [Alphaproteobacteria bacterium]|nr:50S ribosomal protein L25/general stress protein Ctc [Alphaproteobacteria bacterium]MDA7983558.1 50S ribosomal protein L25/general stress protein Ctc [Alphaproteobacteria bacterium]MDA7984839.1 50S ribosomal protein L25/general stress protein Ctc [Alphaproteobacteria bacterium]MDA7987655.1 50S ribosomal protein L25/general stress protein Ctc [Alphaproteobacteria bacterium]MDA7988718.1 50S ribosomal protein L25/general stress protein Ctc [Alphaproteobacteria bacterium]